MIQLNNTASWQSHTLYNSILCPPPPPSPLPCPAWLSVLVDKFMTIVQDTLLTKTFLRWLIKRLRIATGYSDLNRSAVHKIDTGMCQTLLVATNYILWRFFTRLNFTAYVTNKRPTTSDHFVKCKREKQGPIGYAIMTYPRRIPRITAFRRNEKSRRSGGAYQADLLTLPFMHYILTWWQNDFRRFSSTELPSGNSALSNRTSSLHRGLGVRPCLIRQHEEGESEVAPEAHSKWTYFRLEGIQRIPEQVQLCGIVEFSKVPIHKFWIRDWISQCFVRDECGYLSTVRFEISVAEALSITALTFTCLTRPPSSYCDKFLAASPMLNTWDSENIRCAAAPPNIELHASDFWRWSSAERIHWVPSYPWPQRTLHSPHLLAHASGFPRWWRLRSPRRRVQWETRTEGQAVNEKKCNNVTERITSLTCSPLVSSTLKELPKSAKI